MIKILVVGCGEVGLAHARILSKRNSVEAVDIDPTKVPKEFKRSDGFRPDLVLFAMRYSENFVADCHAYIEAEQPKFIGVLTTVPPGTTEKVDPLAVHSTTRGLHPKLDEGLCNIPKHYGGKLSKFFADTFEMVGIPTGGIYHRAITTEVAHILNNVAYGANVALAEEMANICRHYGVDYVESVLNYTQTNNIGYQKLDMASKCRMVLTPPGAKIGGHCLNMSANLLPEEIRGPIIDRVATYNQRTGD